MRHVLCGAAFVAAALVGPAAAETATLTAGSAGAAPGSTVRVPVRLSSPGLVGALDFHVDAAGLTTNDVAYTGLLFSHGWTGWDNAPAVDAFVQAACVFLEDQVTGADIMLVELIVDVPADATPGTNIPVRLVDPFVSDYSFTPYDVTVIDGTIAVTTAACAEDLNDDGDVNFTDLLTVMSSWGPCTCAADLDEDGAVGLPDLLRVLASWGPCP